MNSRFAKWTIALVIIISASIFVFKQQGSKPNTYYQWHTKEYSLDSIFPVDDIHSITVKNYHGTRTLTEGELSFLKDQLKEAKYARGLLVKPGHIELSFKLETKTKASPGYVYAYQGNINFDGATDRAGNYFNGTFYLPLDINFDNY